MFRSDEAENFMKNAGHGDLIDRYKSCDITRLILAKKKKKNSNIETFKGNLRDA